MMNSKEEFFRGCLAGLIGALTLGAILIIAAEQEDLREQALMCQLSQPRFQQDANPTSKEILEATTIE